MNNGMGNNYDITEKMLHELKVSRNNLWWLGALLVIVGSLAIIFAGVSTVFSMVYLGSLLVVVGIFKIIKAFQTTSWGSYFWLTLIIGALMGVAGVFIVMNPLLNAITLTLFLAFFFIVSGALRLFVGLTQRIPHKSLVIVTGFLNIVLGVLIWSQWPSSGLWVIGMFVGIDTLFAGWACISLASYAGLFVR